MAKAHRHGRILPVRFRDEDLKAFEAAAKASEQKLSEWIRSTLRAAIQS